MDKTILITLIALFGIIVLAVVKDANYIDKCKQQGGIVIGGYMSLNCWKDNGFIKIN